MAPFGGKSSRERFWKNNSQCRDILLQVKLVIASFRCYDNSDVIATLIITNFNLYLIHLWWQFFKIFVYGDVVYSQTWEVLSLKNCIEPPQVNRIHRLRFWTAHYIEKPLCFSDLTYCLLVTASQVSFSIYYLLSGLTLFVMSGVIISCHVR